MTAGGLGSYLSCGDPHMAFHRRDSFLVLGIIHQLMICIPLSASRWPRSSLCALRQLFRLLKLNKSTRDNAFQSHHLTMHLSSEKVWNVFVSSRLVYTHQVGDF